ncbi:hypothetical protein E4U19_003842 [Claviceps sp. Clav32 group G5]|nr:hypothetical protein E4U19_003842 [Claviceps sp. Clav32 group G5]
MALMLNFSPFGSLHEHVALESNDTRISKFTDFGPSPSPVPSNTTFTVPKPGNAGPDDRLPQLSVKLALGSPESPMIRPDIVFLSSDPKNETLTRDFWGVNTSGHSQNFLFMNIGRRFKQDGIIFLPTRLRSSIQSCC